MGNVLHLELDARSSAGSVLREVRLWRHGTADAKEISYEIVGGTGPERPPTMDGFVFAVLLHAMRQGEPLRVLGRMSRTALYNIEDLQSFWLLWCPQRYKRIEIQPEEV